jgi:hypothetical protein
VPPRILRWYPVFVKFGHPCINVWTVQRIDLVFTAATEINRKFHLYILAGLSFYSCIHFGIVYLHRRWSDQGRIEGLGMWIIQEKREMHTGF